MDNMNIDENTMNNIKNMVDNGKLQDAISQISPEMLQNFSKMMQNNQASTSNKTTEHGSQDSQNYTNQSNNAGTNNFDMSNLDMGTIMKVTSAFNNMNKANGNDPRANLLNSLKPYLRDNKKDKLNNYMNLLNVTKIAEVMNNNNLTNNSYEDKK